VIELTQAKNIMSSNKESTVRSHISIQFIEDPAKSVYQEDGFNPDKAIYFTEKKKVIARSMLFLLCLSVLLLGKAFGCPDISYPAIHDVVMEALEPINNLINNNEFWNKTLEILSSGMMDTIFLLTFIPWIFKGRTGRIMYAMAAFYSIRSFTQQLVMLPFPPGYSWNYPGWPSIVVPYGVFSDFFFSGHVGFLMLLACENYAIGRKWLFWTAIGCQPFLIIVMISYRVHYTCDVVAGLFIAHWVFMMAEKAAPTVDKFFINLYINVHDRVTQSAPQSPTTEAESPQPRDDKKSPLI